MQRRRTGWLTALLVLGASGTALSAPSLDDFKRFRALSIDLQGRMPTREEVIAFSKPGFDLEGWIDQRLGGPDYARRLARVYLDRLRLRVNQAYNFPGNGLVRATIQDEQGRNVWVYYRKSQKRMRGDTRNGSFCLTKDEVGFDMNQTTQPGIAVRVPTQLLDTYTVKVKPWWLYADYQSPSPTQRYNAQDWLLRWGYQLNNNFVKDPDGRDTVEVRVCREEAAEADTALRDGTVESVDCTSNYGFRVSSNCGCGRGLERCMPNANNDGGNGAAPFLNAWASGPLRADPYVSTAMSYPGLMTELTAQEVERFLEALFAEDRDVREMITGRWTYVNGPLAQFYRDVQRSYWSDFARAYTNPTMVADPASMPPAKALSPYDMNTWVRVDDRGPLAAGVMTMPVFLRKYATRRARAHVVYNAFQCKDFVAPPGLKLTASKEPDLTKRDGCNYCHIALEPMSSYFARVVESDWSWLDAKYFPARDLNCKIGYRDGTCGTRYDPVFATMEAGFLRGAYASPDNADVGPAGLGAKIASSPDFAGCVVENVAESFLGRPLSADDAALKQALVEALVKADFHPRALVRALVRSDAYLRANDLTSGAWRNQGGGQ